MPAAGRSCGTCAHRHEVDTGIPGVLELECRQAPPHPALLPRLPDVRTDEDPSDPLAPGVDEMTADVLVDVARWPAVQPDEWCGQWAAEQPAPHGTAPLPSPLAPEPGRQLDEGIDPR